MVVDIEAGLSDVRVTDVVPVGWSDESKECVSWVM